MTPMSSMQRYLMRSIAALAVAGASILGARTITSTASHDEQISNKESTEAVSLSTTTTAVATTTTAPPPPTTTIPTTTTAAVQRTRVQQPAPAPGSVEALIRATWPADQADKAVAVARCESGLNPGARSGAHYGIFQISRRWHEARVARMGYTWDDGPSGMLSAGPNISVAFAIWQEQGWRPWTCARR